jgi:myo-inositol-1(or 4)-monophosphatase
MPSPLSIAISAATAAGNILRRKFREAREVKSKGWRDIVTDADFAAQKIILRHLTAQFPKHAILSEEGQHDIDLDSATPTWVIDPLDGTTNYSRQFPSFCVSIALARNGAPQVGVIHNPLTRETFYATRGHGAFHQIGRGPARRMRVSALTDFAGALVGVDWARDPVIRQQVLDGLGRVAHAGRTIRAVGSAALGLAYVAAGWLDGYYHLALQPWDVAAGALLVNEAGGALSAPDGGAWQLTGRAAVASNGALHAALIATLQLA